ncbi:MAG: putative DNA binding domain-containing protein [Bacteroidetes bacterium]|nr:putative DNA binding domain-containing protein [Bacteroidota bacterium]
MHNTSTQILKQLSLGEDSYSEFKRVIMGKRGVKSPNEDAIASEMVAFANSQGGTIFLGVDDDGIVRGLPKDQIKDVEHWIINVATKNCDPPIQPLLQWEHLPAPDGSMSIILLVKIPKGLFVHITNSGRHYLRVGSTKQMLKGTMLARLFQERERTFIFDEQSVPGTTIDDLDQRKLEYFFDGIPKTIPWLDLLQNTKVISRVDDDPFRPTVTGLLIFGTTPQSYMQNAYIEAAVYRSIHLTSDDLVHSERIEGTVDIQIESAIKFVDRFMLKPARKPAGRIDYPQYDLRAIREAIVNAVAHRDYSIRGSKIRLFLFSDRIEIYSPGDLPNAITIESMAYRVFTRNQLLVNFLSRIKSPSTDKVILESRGEGVRTILSLGEVHSGRTPINNLYGEELVLTICAKPSPHQSS